MYLCHERVASEKGGRRQRREQLHALRIPFSPELLKHRRSQRFLLCHLCVKQVDVGTEFIQERLGHCKVVRWSLLPKKPELTHSCKMQQATGPSAKALERTMELASAKSSIGLPSSTTRPSCKTTIRVQCCALTYESVTPSEKCKHSCTSHQQQH